MSSDLLPGLRPGFHWRTSIPFVESKKILKLYYVENVEFLVVDVKNVEAIVFTVFDVCIVENKNVEVFVADIIVDFTNVWVAVPPPL